MKNKSNVERRYDISEKFLAMGESLLKEGNAKNDFCIKQSGTFMMFLAGIVLDEQDTHDFGQLCGMFSAKKILSSMESIDSDMMSHLKEPLSPPNQEITSSIEEFLKKLSGEKNKKPRKGGKNKSGGDDTPSN
jgi:hypothetical protein